MLKFFLLFLTVLSSSFLWATEHPLFECNLNRNEKLIIYTITPKTTIESVRLEKLTYDNTLIDTITLNNLQFINYGSSYIITADHGRSGFVSINLVKEEGPISRYIGHLHFELFNTAFQTEGVQLSECQLL